MCRWTQWDNLSNYNKWCVCYLTLVSWRKLSNYWSSCVYLRSPHPTYFNYYNYSGSRYSISSFPIYLKQLSLWSSNVEIYTVTIYPVEKILLEFNMFSLSLYFYISLWNGFSKWDIRGYLCIFCIYKNFVLSMVPILCQLYIFVT